MAAAPLIEIDACRALRSFGPIGPAPREGTVRGIYDVAFGAARLEKGQLPRRIDRSSAFTRKSVHVDRAAATQSMPKATVKMGDQRVINLFESDVLPDGWRGAVGEQLLKSPNADAMAKLRIAGKMMEAKA